MNDTVIAVGNGGYNLAADLIATGLFPDAQLIICDTNENDLGKNSANATETFLLEKLRGKVKSGDAHMVDDIVEKASDSVIICAGSSANVRGGLAENRLARYMKNL